SPRAWASRSRPRSARSTGSRWRASCVLRPRRSAIACTSRSRSSTSSKRRRASALPVARPPRGARRDGYDAGAHARGGDLLSDGTPWTSSPRACVRSLGRKLDQAWDEAERAFRRLDPRRARHRGGVLPTSQIVADFLAAAYSGSLDPDRLPLRGRLLLVQPRDPLVEERAEREELLLPRGTEVRACLRREELVHEREDPAGRRLRLKLRDPLLEVRDALLELCLRRHSC